MKIVTWNCNGGFRKKFEYLSEFRADILVIQECENPVLTKDINYRDWATNFHWTGENKNKGLGIFAKKESKLELLDWDNTGLKYFIPCFVNEDFLLLATWCHRANSDDFDYIGQLWKYLQIHKSKLVRTIIAGDLNSNSIWDKWDRRWNHSNVVKELRDIHIESLYHQYFKEENGKEKQPTLYHLKNVLKPYHVDYIFASSEFSNSVKTIAIGESAKWLKMSDHMPVFCEFS